MLCYDKVATEENVAYIKTATGVLILFSHIRHIFSMNPKVGHVSDIGYNFKNQNKFKRFVTDQLPHTEIHSFDGGSYHILKDTSGTELWLQTSHNENGVSIMPYFCGKSVRTVTIEEARGHLLYCWSDPTSTVTDSSYFPFIVDVPDYHLFGNNAAAQNMNLVIFAEEVLTYKDEREFYENQQAECTFAPESFFPTSSFAYVADGTVQTLFHGKIIEFEEKKNSISGETFHWFLCHTLGGEIDVVADSRFAMKHTAVGSIVKVSGHLTGKFVTTETQEG